MDVAADAVVANDEERTVPATYDAVLANDEVRAYDDDGITPDTNDAVAAYDADIDDDIGFVEFIFVVNIVLTRAVDVPIFGYTLNIFGFGIKSGANGVASIYHA
jgi:hypothetical protein